MFDCFASALNQSINEPTVDRTSPLGDETEGDNATLLDAAVEQQILRSGTEATNEEMEDMGEEEDEEEEENIE